MSAEVVLSQRPSLSAAVAETGATAYANSEICEFREKVLPFSGHLLCMEHIVFHLFFSIRRYMKTKYPVPFSVF